MFWILLFVPWLLLSLLLLLLQLLVVQLLSPLLLLCCLCGLLSLAMTNFLARFWLDLNFSLGWFLMYWLIPGWSECSLEYYSEYLSGSETVPGDKGWSLRGLSEIMCRHSIHSIIWLYHLFPHWEFHLLHYFIYQVLGWPNFSKFLLKE